VEEQRGGGEIDAEMEGFPKAAAEAKPEIGSNDNEGQQVECHGANGVYERLAGRADGAEEVQKAKAWVLVEEQMAGCRKDTERAM